jgi:hypothetical protein
MKAGRILFILLLIIQMNELSSQSKTVAGLFPAIDHSGKLTKKVDYSLYYFAAVPVLDFSSNEIRNETYLNLFYLEQAINYSLNDFWTFTSAYVYQLENVGDKLFSQENRFHLQAKYSKPYAKFKLTYRLRFDGRFVNKPSNDQTPFTSRIRYLIGLNLPLNETLYFTLYEEAFFNTYQDASVVYGENWAFAGFGKNLNQKNKLELGLLYITWNTGTQSWFNQYYLQLTWINQLNFSKSTNS